MGTAGKQERGTASYVGTGKQNGGQHPTMGTGGEEGGGTHLRMGTAGKTRTRRTASYCMGTAGKQELGGQHPTAWGQQGNRNWGDSILLHGDSRETGTRGTASYCMGTAGNGMGQHPLRSKDTGTGDRSYSWGSRNRNWGTSYCMGTAGKQELGRPCGAEENRDWGQILRMGTARKQGTGGTASYCMGTAGKQELGDSILLHEDSKDTGTGGTASYCMGTAGKQELGGQHPTAWGQQGNRNWGTASYCMRTARTQELGTASYCMGTAGKQELGDSILLHGDSRETGTGGQHPTAWGQQENRTGGQYPTAWGQQGNRNWGTASYARGTVKRHRNWGQHPTAWGQQGNRNWGTASYCMGTAGKQELGDSILLHGDSRETGTGGTASYCMGTAGKQELGGQHPTAWGQQGNRNWGCGQHLTARKEENPKGCVGGGSFSGCLSLWPLASLARDSTNSRGNQDSIECQHFGRPRRVDLLRLGVRDQPGQNGETLSLLKIQKLAGHGGGHLLGNSARLCFKKKKKEKKKKKDDGASLTVPTSPYNRKGLTLSPGLEYKWYDSGSTSSFQVILPPQPPKVLELQPATGYDSRKRKQPGLYSQRTSLEGPLFRDELVLYEKGCGPQGEGVENGKSRLTQEIAELSPGEDPMAPASVHSPTLPYSALLEIPQSQSLEWVKSGFEWQTAFIHEHPLRPVVCQEH
ncbi:hypothetical protein AAY473_021291 [Plecturocebus cupreus]